MCIYIQHCFSHSLFDFLHMVFLRIRAVPASAIFYISERFGLPGICSRCFSVSFLIITRIRINTGTAKVFICHNNSTSISRSLYLDSY